MLSSTAAEPMFDVPLHPSFKPNLLCAWQLEQGTWQGRVTKDPEAMELKGVNNVPASFFSPS